MPRISSKDKIIKAIREYLVAAVKRLEPITDERLIKAAECARATFYKYVTKGSDIEAEIQIARAKQKKYAEQCAEGTEENGYDLDLRKRLEEAESGNRVLLALIARFIANLGRWGVRAEVIQKAWEDPIDHPDRRVSHAGKGRRRRR